MIKKHLSLPNPNTSFHFHPTQLDPVSRQAHVRKALQIYNAGIIQNNPQGAQRKFEKLTQSPFIFFRGTADLFYRDLFGTDADKAIVLCMGDVHLENYGVMETEDGHLIWGLNDFDEAAFAPFSWDVKRGATSAVLAAQENEAYAPKRFKLAAAFTKAYLKTIYKGLDEKQPGYKTKKAPKIIKDLIKKAKEVDTQNWLKADYLDPDADRPKFQLTAEIQPFTPEASKSLSAEIQQALDHYRTSLKDLNQPIPQAIKVLDVATKVGSGTGSIGLWRYYALVAIEQHGQEELVILEIKQERPSVVGPYFQGGPLTFASEGSRVAFAEQVQLPNANPFYGYTQLGAISYLVRKRSPHKKRVKLEKLDSYKAFKQYVEACGKTLAIAHMRSHEVVNSPLDLHANERILQSINQDTFLTQIAGFAEKMAAQVEADWLGFKRAFEGEGFDF